MEKEEAKDTLRNDGQVQPVILSGGSGTRLWPLSDEHRPKQFLSLVSDLSMLQLTLQRVSGKRAYALPIIVANASHRDALEQQLAAIECNYSTLILEPLARNTAPAITLAAIRVTPDTPLLVMPSDHVIRDVEAFDEAVQRALPGVAGGHLITFGIKPTAPETGFGYIEAGDLLHDGLRRADRFVEKPDAETALEYIARGDFYWNGGIFLFRAGDFLKALERCAPDILRDCKLALSRGSSDDVCVRPDYSSFARCRSISIDYAVMEKADDVAVCPIDVGWSDIGSWDALYEYLNGAGTPVADDRVIEIGSEGCFVRSSGPLIATAGVRDLIIVATEQAVLVIPRGESQKLQEIIARIHEREQGTESCSGRRS